MLARRGVIADQLSDSQVQEVLGGNSPNCRDSSLSQLQGQSAVQRPEPTDITEPCGTIPPPDSDSASETSSQSNKTAIRQEQGKHHSHHQWDNLPGITSEAEVLRQMREQHKGQSQSYEREKKRSDEGKEVVLEGQAGSTPRQRQAASKGKERATSRGREGSTESHEASVVGGQSHSKNRRSSSASSSMGEGGTRGRETTEGYDPNDYDRGAYVETSRVGLE